MPASLRGSNKTRLFGKVYAPQQFLESGLGVLFSEPGIHFHKYHHGGVLGVASDWQDIMLGGIFVSLGTEGFNTQLKFAKYNKEASKAGDDKQAAAGNQKLQLVSKQA